MPGTIKIRCCAGNWIAYDGNQAIWESWSRPQLIRDLVARGYARKQIVWQPIKIV